MVIVVKQRFYAGGRTVKIDYKIAFIWANSGKVSSVVETSIKKLIKTRKLRQKIVKKRV